jgi:hypothetical protein
LLLFRESLYEDDEFDLHQRQLAALLVSKVLTFFFLVFLLHLSVLPLYVT